MSGQDGAAEAPSEVAGRPGAGEQTIDDGRGGVITKTAASTSGESYAGGTIVENDVGDSQEELMAAIEATIKPFDEGDLVNGVVVKIDKDEVLLDIGYKSEGVIPLRELSIRNDVDPNDVFLREMSSKPSFCKRRMPTGASSCPRNERNTSAHGAASKRSRPVTAPSPVRSSKSSKAA